MDPFRIVLMGTGPFAVPAFDALLQANPSAIVHVISRPTPTQPGKGTPPPNPVWEWASQRHLPIAQPNSINDPETIDWLCSLSPSLFVVCDYGQILSATALAAATLGGLNLHGSLLPRHRGAAPVQWALLHGDASSGVSVIHMTPRLDGGPILTSASTPILPRENAAQLEARLSALGVTPLLQAIDALKPLTTLPDSPIGLPQDPSRATKAPRLEKRFGIIDFHQPSHLIARQIQGLTPWPNAFAELECAPDKRLRINLLDTEPLPPNTPPIQLPPPGTLLWGPTLAQHLPPSQPLTPSHATNPSPAASVTPIQPVLAVVTGSGLLAIHQLQPAGKRAMLAKEFLAGYQRHASMRFIPPTAPNPLYSMMQP